MTPLPSRLVSCFGRQTPTNLPTLFSSRLSSLRDGQPQTLFSSRVSVRRTLLNNYHFSNWWRVCQSQVQEKPSRFLDIYLLVIIWVPWELLELPLQLINIVRWITYLNNIWWTDREPFSFGFQFLSSRNLKTFSLEIFKLPISGSSGSISLSSNSTGSSGSCKLDQGVSKQFQ